MEATLLKENNVHGLKGRLLQAMGGNWCLFRGWEKLGNSLAVLDKAVQGMAFLREESGRARFKET